ncbi:MAG: cell envelope biogenesis protein TonB [Lysobacteraceae bacterium]|nr:MAG: cell envelope biogenesis protein TonB [Xanthomonadaceae bacterium]
MNANAAVAAGPAPEDRLSLTIVLALIVHAAFILGVTFNYEDLANTDALPTLDVILVQRSTQEAPEEADYLAQVSQQGGGTEEEKVRPQAPISGEILKPDPGLAPAPVTPAAPPPQPQTPVEVLTVDSSPQSVPDEPQTEESQPRELPSARQLMERSMEIARLEAEIGRRAEAYARRPKRKWISANTREYEFASYMQAWVAKVERVGNLNYPDEARRQRLNGNLVLSVAIARDGSVESIEIIRPSGHKILDDAAIRIVQLAAPYSELPPNIEGVDILHITRTWQFLPGNMFRHE